MTSGSSDSTDEASTEPPAGFDGREFRRVLGHYPTGVVIVTAACDSGPEGLTIGSFASVSLDPPLVSFCPGHDSDSWAKMRHVGSFCVNVLGDDQSSLSNTFAGKDLDRFDGVDTRVEATGAPVIEGCVAWIDCTVDVVHTAGDHDIVIGRVRALGTASDGDRGPLIFYQGGYRRTAGL